MTYLHLSLPFPPSGNRYWRHVKGRTILAKAARDYRKAVDLAVMQQNARAQLACPLTVSAALTAPDRRKRDLDNYWKQLADALQHAGVYIDDSQIQALQLAWTGETVAPGGVVVSISRKNMPQIEATPKATQRSAKKASAGEKAVSVRNRAVCESARMEG